MLKRTLFSQEHDHYRDAFNMFLDREVTPFQEQWEKDRMVSRDVWRKAGEYGFLCAWLDEKYGGAGADFIYSVVTIEAMAHRRLGAPSFHLHDRIVVPYLARLGSEEQKQRWLPGCASGETITAIGMTEPGAGSDLAAIRTRAVRDGDSYVINGQKTFISNGQICNLVVVACKTNPQADPPHRGISLFVVEEGTPGFKKGRNLEKIGRHVGRTFLDRLVEAHMAGESIDMETSMAKWWITDMHFQVVNQCLQFFGGYGYMTEYPISKAFTDARVESIFAGSNEVMKSIIAKRMGL